jgi:F0F1-type ATP synthase assembly protein I
MTSYFIEGIVGIIIGISMGIVLDNFLHPKS